MMLWQLYIKLLSLKTVTSEISKLFPSTLNIEQILFLKMYILYFLNKKGNLNMLFQAFLERRRNIIQVSENTLFTYQDAREKCFLSDANNIYSFITIIFFKKNRICLYILKEMHVIFWRNFPKIYFRLKARQHKILDCLSKILKSELKTFQIFLFLAFRIWIVQWMRYETQ